MKIYTKTGDKGQTSLVSGQRVEKHHKRIEAYGTVDELNSVLGVANSYMDADHPLQNAIKDIQHQLFTLGSHLSCDQQKTKEKLPPLKKEWVESMEKNIDHFQEELPELKQFILPGGGPAAAFLHFARTIARRAERTCSELIATDDVDEFHLIYLNRLSDLLFVFARYANHFENIKDVSWTKQ